MKRMIKLLPLRRLNQMGFWLCTSALLFALYLQYYGQLSPCPLCIAQRLMISLLGLTFLFGWLHLYRGNARKLHGLCITFFALIGTVLAGRQVWLEHLPPGYAPPCGPSLNYMLEHLPLHKILQTLFQGTAECTDISWQMLGFTLPNWTLILFSLSTLVGIWQILRKDEQ